MDRRIPAIDALKGLAILAVVLYHFGGSVLPCGYLGVDVFFVIGGFFLIKSMRRRLEEGSFSYWRFLFRKAVRLWPPILVASAVALLLGLFLFLPDDFENLAESVIASSMFANNILQCITTRNYWDVVNLYKPLMHLWYAGVLMQAYVVIPLIVMFFARRAKDVRKSVAVSAAGITAVSLILFLLPVSSAWRFYYLPFRLFELSAGGLLAAAETAGEKRSKKWVCGASVLVLLLLMCSRVEILSGSAMLLATVIGSLAFLWAVDGTAFDGRLKPLIGAFAAIGKRSYSIYIWHQVIVADLFYSVFPEQSFPSLAAVLVITAAVSALSYRYLELPLGGVIGKKKREAAVLVGSVAIAAALCFASVWIYAHAGVVRDVPELGVFRNDVHRGMHAEYCDRPYAWDKDFENDGRVRVLVIGNSFGRDWANILFEYDTEHRLDISYLYFSNGYTDDDLRKHQERIGEADFVFCTKVSGIEQITAIPGDKLFVVGNKIYGKSNGIIYAKRGSDSYYEQSVLVDVKLREENARMASAYGDHFIDLMKPVMTDESHVRVFTDEHMLISQDCRHLTQAGARYYARILDWSSIFGVKSGETGL